MNNKELNRTINQIRNDIKKIQYHWKTRI